ncbi:MAG: DUF1800 domain-containing protein [Acidobacteriota bacterium]|nr:DUF1800 domain-containing protein [Acidobacteriota bacterium]
MHHRASATLSVVCSLSVLSGISAYAKKKKVEYVPPPVSDQMTADQKVLHMISRLTFGPRPGDVVRVKEMGLAKWIEQQLHPETIAENPVLAVKLQPLDTLRMTPLELVSHYPPPQQIKAMVDGRVPYPTDPETKRMIQKLVSRYKSGFNQNGKEAAAIDMKPASFEKVVESFPPEQRRVLESGSAPEKIALIESMPDEKQMDVIEAMPQGARLKFFAVAPPALRRKIQKFGTPQQVVAQDLSDAKLYRAVYSDRQLEEVLTDFWYNHFNVFLDKGADRYLVTSYERDAIRPYVLGNFKDMVLATAKSPAMLFYLDNFQSVGPNAGPPAGKGKKNGRGLNENYGRELMELHTLGVDGGYTQHDVTEVARCFTGWTIRDPQRGATFEFNERSHDKGEKTVLGTVIPAGGGIEDGLKVIDLLVSHPSTARFIARSLAIRFVSDTPPASLIDKMVSTFSTTHGDLREVMKTMISAPEFTSKSAWRAKFKTPLEMVASAIRATGGDMDFGFTLAQQLNTLGEPLYRKQEPTGFSNKNAEWLNSAALLARMNFALALTNNKLPGVKVDMAKFDSSADPMGVAKALLMTDVSAAARASIAQGIQEQASGNGENKTPPAALVAGLTLGSPDFQRR